MNKFSTYVDIFDVFSRKKTMGWWIWTMAYIAGVMAIDLHILITDKIPAESIPGILFFGFFVLFFLCGLIFQLFHKPKPLFMVVHTRTGLAILKTPVTEDVAKLHARGIRGDSFSYIPYKDYLKMKEVN